MPNLESLLNRLIRKNVDFVVIGGFAAVAHGSSLLTQDIDICCDLSPENLERILSAIGSLHPFHRMIQGKRAFTKEDFHQGFKNIYLDTDEGQIDCLNSVKGIGSFSKVRKSSFEIKLSAGSCRVLSLDALIKSKEALSRKKDKEAILQLKAIRDRLSNQE